MGWIVRPQRVRLEQHTQRLARAIPQMNAEIHIIRLSVTRTRWTTHHGSREQEVRSRSCQHRVPTLHREACDFGRGMWDVSKVIGKSFVMCWSHYYRHVCCRRHGQQVSCHRTASPEAELCKCCASMQSGEALPKRSSRIVSRIKPTRPTPFAVGGSEGQASRNKVLQIYLQTLGEVVDMELGDGQHYSGARCQASAPLHSLVC